MTRFAFFIVLALAGSLAAGCSSSSGSGKKGNGPDPVEFDELSMIFEQNDTDQDAEIVIEAQGEEAFETFQVFAPDGRRVVDLRAESRLGMAEVLVESGEPDIDSVKATYPEGTYTFRATSIEGTRYAGEVDLSHDLLAAPSITAPTSGGNVDASGAVVTWTAIAGADRIVIEIEQDDLGLNLTTTIPGDATSFAIPDGFLVSGEEFELGVAAVGAEGNVIVSEIAFDVN